MKAKNIGELGPRQLWNLRKDVVLNSLYLEDYENRYGVPLKEVYDFFDGWLDFLEELMEEDYPDYEDTQFFDLFPKYDTPKNLYKWWLCWVG